MDPHEPSSSDNTLARNLPEDPMESYRPAGNAPFLPGEVPVPGVMTSMTRWIVLPEDDSSSGEVSRPAGPAPSYILRRHIARGGMGEVWEALQVSLGRVVAVKKVREDRITDDDPRSSHRRFLEAQFRQEAMIAARLEHPNIVPVHDLGTDELGHSLLAMKMVQGVSWKKMVRDDAKVMTPVDLLAKHLPILISLSQAVAFAHSREIIHRDLKPAQVMVGEFGEVVLMDWGLAVYLGDPEAPPDPLDVTASNLQTASNPAGTPVMMAPEQTEDSAKRLGKWTDVYLLGGTLYYLLTGRYPHQVAGGSAGAIRHAREGIVLPPEKLAPEREIPTELAELCMKALSPRPEDRVPSARAFITGLEEYLSGAGRRREAWAIMGAVHAALPKAAGSYSALGDCLTQLARAGELWPGSPDVSVLRAQVLVDFCHAALAGGDLRLAQLQADQIPARDVREQLVREVAAATARAARRERQRSYLARISATLAILLITSAAYFIVRLDRAKDRITRQRDQGREVISFMMEDLSGKLNSVGRLGLLKDVAEKVVDYYAQLDEEDRSTRITVNAGEALLQIARVHGDQGNLADEQHALDAAEKLLSSDRKRFGLPEVQAVVARAQAHRAGAALVAGKLEEADRLGQVAEKTLRTINFSDPRERAIIGDSLATVLANRAASRMRMGDLEGTLKLQQEARTLQERAAEVLDSSDSWRGLSRILNDLATTSLLLGKEAQCGEAREASAKVMEDYVARFPEDTKALEYLSTALSNKGHFLSRRGDNEESLSLNERAAEIMRKLVALDPSNIVYNRMLGINLGNVAEGRQRLGHVKEALADVEEVITIFRRLVQRSPDSPAFLDSLHHVLGSKADIILQLGRAEESLAVRQESLACLEAAVRLSPADSDLADSRAVVYNEMAFPLVALGCLDEGILSLEKSLEIREESSAREPSNASRASEIYPIYNNLGALASRKGDKSATKAYRLRGLKLMDGLLDRFPDNTAFRAYHVRALENISQSVEDEGDFKQSIGFLQLAIQESESIEGPEASSRIPILYYALARNYHRDNNLEQSLICVRKATALLPQALAYQPDDPLLNQVRRNAPPMEGRVLSLLGRDEEARIPLLASLATYAKEPAEGVTDLQNLAEVYLRLGETAAATETLRKLQDLDGIDEGLRKLASEKGIKVDDISLDHRSP